MKWNWKNEPTGLGILDLLLWGWWDSTPGWKQIMESWVNSSTQWIPSRVNDVIRTGGVAISCWVFATSFLDNLKKNDSTITENIRSYFSFLFPWITAWKRLDWWAYHKFVAGMNNVSNNSFLFPSQRNFHLSKKNLLQMVTVLMRDKNMGTFLSSVDWYNKVVALLDAEKQKKEKWPTRTTKTPE